MLEKIPRKRQGLDVRFCYGFGGILFAAEETGRRQNTAAAGADSVQCDFLAFLGNELNPNAAVHEDQERLAGVARAKDELVGCQAHGNSRLE